MSSAATEDLRTLLVEGVGLSADVLAVRRRVDAWLEHLKAALWAEGG